MDELDRLAAKLEERRKNRIAEYAFQNVINVDDIYRQLDILLSFGDSIEWLDITNDPGLPSELKGGRSTKAQKGDCMHHVQGQRIILSWSQSSVIISILELMEHYRSKQTSVNYEGRNSEHYY